ncbi:MAG: ATP-binding protein [Verrucomicrobiota bacterium]
MLGLNFLGAGKVSEEALAINLAGRQRMLSQRITKSLLQIEIALQTEQSPQDALDELNLAFDLFDTTLNAFDLGGFTKDANLVQRSLKRVTNQNARTAVESGAKIWEPFKALLRPILMSDATTIRQEQLEEAMTYASQNNLGLLAEMNNLTVALEKQANAGANQSRALQTVALILVLLLFGYVVYDFVTKIRTGDIQIEEKRRDLEVALEEVAQSRGELASQKAETDAILATVREGLLLVDSDFEISNQYSEALKAMFQLDDLAGLNLLGILQRCLTQKNYMTAKDYVQMLFEPNRKEKTLMKINPLEEAEVHFQEQDATFTTRYYRFQFKRLKKDGVIDRVFVSISDVSAQVELEQKLKEAEKDRERQMALLADVVNADRAQVADFCASATTSLREVNDLLRAEDFIGRSLGSEKHAELHSRVQNVFRKVHSIKGHATALNLSYFIEMSHDFEDVISKIRSRPRLSGEDFLGVVTQLAEFDQGLRECSELLEQLYSISGVESPRPEILSVNDPNPSEGEKSWRVVESLVSNLMRETGKLADLELSISDGTKLNGPTWEALSECWQQLVRNSFAHGIESPEERKAKGKAATAKIRVGIRRNENGQIRAEYREDGRGLQTDQIRERCIRAGLMETEEASKKPDEDIWPYLFQPGISTSAEVTELAGRGVGLDVIKEKVMNEMGGGIYIDSQLGRHVTFVFEFPEHKDLSLSS